MAVTDIPASGWLWFFVVAIALLQVYNTVCTAKKNQREEQKVKNAPHSDLAQKVTDHARMLDNDKRRLDEHERQMLDTKKGTMALCSGVQALLEHELHNGNTKEMEDASAGIDKWLRERP